MNLSGNTLLITGGGSGIGLELAKAFQTHSNNTVIVCGRDQEKLKTAQAFNRDIKIFQCDITQDMDQKRLVDSLTNDYPRLNVLINNAGIQHNYSFADRQNHIECIEEEVNSNFLAHVKLTDRLLPKLLQQPNAAIINITSALAVVPKQSAPIYCATKAAMRSFTKALRYQLEATPVKVFEIVPALVDTAMTKGRGKGKITPEALAAKALRGIESDRLEIRIEKTKILFALHRLLPSLAERILRSG